MVKSEVGTLQLKVRVGDLKCNQRWEHESVFEVYISTYLQASRYNEKAYLIVHAQLSSQIQAFYYQSNKVQAYHRTK